MTMTTNRAIIRELVEKRTPYAKTYLLADGSFETHLTSGAPIHYEDEHGNLHNVDTRLFDAADFDQLDGPASKYAAATVRAKADEVRLLKGKQALDRTRFDYHAVKTPFFPTLPRQIRRGYSMEYGVDRLHLVPSNASPATGHLLDEAPNVVMYQDVWNDVDVRLEITDLGVKATYTLKTDRAPTFVSWEVRGGDLTDDLTCGALRIEPAWLADARGERRDVELRIRRENGKTYLDVNADVSGLTYPIIVDPTTTFQPSAATGWDNRLDPTAPNTVFANDTEMFLGSDGGGINIRGILRFDISSITGPVSSATLTLTVTSGSSTSAPLSYLYRNTASWSPGTVTYNNAPAYASATSGSDYVNISIPASPGNPWNYAFDVNVTSMVSAWQTGANANYGWTLIVDPNKVNTWKYIGTSNNANAAVRPKLIVVWNQPPGAPTVTAPNGGENWNAQHTITWSAASDVDTATAALQYEIGLSTNNGGSWTTLVALTAAGATSYTYDFSAIAESTTCLLRIRAYDGASYGPYDQSNAVFTIAHNAAPLKPTNLTRANFDAAQAAMMTWVYNDPNAGDSQSAFELEIYDTASPSTPVKSTGKTGSTTSSYTLAANSLANGKTYQWRVRTYDRAGLSSPWSDYATFKCSPVPVASINAPTSGQTIGSDSFVFSGSYTNPTGVVQKSFRFRLYNSAGTTVLQDSGEVLGYLNQYTFFGLANNTSYQIEFSVTSQDDMSATSPKRSFSVSYTPPATPIVTATNDYSLARVIISWTNPAPSGGQPAAARNDVYRRKVGDSAWTLVKQSAVSPYQDYTAGEGTYEYGVTAHSASGAVSAYGTAQVTHSFAGFWLIDESNPLNSSFQFLYSNAPDVEMIVPVYEVQTFAAETRLLKGQTRSYKSTLSALVLADGTSAYAKVDKLEEMAVADKKYLLKMPGGRRYRVALYPPTHKPRFGARIADVSIQWVGEVVK